MNSEKALKEVYMHFGGENCHHHSKKLKSDDDVRAMQCDIYEQTVIEVHLYRTFGNDYEVLNYIKEGRGMFTTRVNCVKITQEERSRG